MFGGYYAPANTSVSSYADAVEVLERFSKTPTGRARKSDYYGYRMSRTSTVRQIGGDAIAFRLHATDCVTWYPDNSFALECWESMTTSQFSSHFSPVYVGASGIVTFDGPPRPPVEGEEPWRARWGNMLLVHGSVRFSPADEGRWVPDEDTCDEFVTLQLDKRGCRAVSKAHNLAEFMHFMRMAPNIAEIEHLGVDREACADALKAKKFLRAAALLPLVKEPSGFAITLKPYRIRAPRGQYVTPTSIQRMKDWLYDQEGLFTRVSHQIMTARQHDNLVRRNAALSKADVGGWLGWR